MKQCKERLFISLFTMALISATQASAAELTNAELDSVTAGFANVAIDANAYAEGSTPNTSADTYTETNEYRVNGWRFSYGSGYGVASACCGNNSATQVNGSTAADGDVVSTYRTPVNTQTNDASYSALWLGVFSITMPEDGPGSNIAIQY